MRVTYFTKAYYAKMRMAKFVVPAPMWDSTDGDFKEVDYMFDLPSSDTNSHVDRYLFKSNNPGFSVYRRSMFGLPEFDWNKEFDMMWKGKDVITAAVSSGAFAYGYADERYTSATSLKAILPFFEGKNRRGNFGYSDGVHEYTSLQLS